MAELKSLIVNGVTRLNNTGYAKNLYADKFITNGGTSSQYVRGDGTLGNISEFSGSGHQHYIGTTQTQSSSANQALTGITSIDGIVSISPTRGAYHFDLTGTDADYGVARIIHTSTSGSGSPGTYTASLAILDQRTANISGAYEPTFFINRTGSTRVPDLIGVNVGGSRVFTIDSSRGYVGIGTTSPRSKLDVYGGDSAAIIGNTGSYSAGNSSARKLRLGLGTVGHTGSNYWAFCVDDTTSSSYLQIGYNENTTGISLRHDGYLGVGINAPSYKLHVYDGLAAVTSNGYTLTMGNQNSDWTHITTSGTHFWFNPSVCVDGNVYPYVSNNNWCGTSGYYWYRVCTAGVIHPGVWSAAHVFTTDGGYAHIGSMSVNYANYAGYLNYSATNISSSGAGWYKLAYINTTDARGSIRLALITTGGNWVPYYAELMVKEGWNVIEFNQYGRFDYISSYRYTRDDSYCYIEAYFTTALTLEVRKFVSIGYINDSNTGWTLYSGTATAGSGTVISEANANTSASLYTSGEMYACSLINTNHSFRINGYDGSYHSSNNISGYAGEIWFGGNFHIDSQNSQSLYLNYYTGAGVFIACGGGNVGIGTDNPAQKLHVNGNTYTNRLLASTNSGTALINTAYNSFAINFREGRSYDTGFFYGTYGNEFLALTTQQSVTSLIFGNGYDPASLTSGSFISGDSNNYNYGTSTDVIQIKQNCMSIGNVWRHGVSPDYKLKVNGTTYISDYLRVTGGIARGSEHILSPAGGSYTNNNSSVTGYIIIRFPYSLIYTMMSVWIDVYSYSTNESFTVQCGGYTYENSFGHAPFAMCIGAQHKIRYCYDADYYYIVVGESNTIWYYPKFMVRDMLVGYSRTVDDWIDKSLYCYISTSLPGTEYTSITRYAITTDNIGSQSVNYANSAGNADTVDSLHAERFAYNFANAQHEGESGYTLLQMAADNHSNSHQAMLYSPADNPVSSSGNWIHVWSQTWDRGVTTSWCSQIALAVQQGTGMYYRTTSGNLNGKAWTRVYDASYHPYAGEADTLDGYHASSFLRYEGWWSSGNGSDAKNASGMVFVYQNHNVPGPNWGTLVTFEYSRASEYRFQLFSDGYRDGYTYYRNRSADRGGWGDWIHLLDSSNSYVSDGYGYINSTLISKTSYASSASWLDISGNFRTDGGLGFYQASSPIPDTSTTGAYTSWQSVIMMSHGNGQTYYHVQMAFPFWDAPRYQRKEGGSTASECQGQWYKFLTEENYTSFVNPRATSKTLWGNTYIDSNGNFCNVDSNIYITTGDSDRFILFRYNSNNYAGAAWRLLSRGSGSGDTNYFDIETGGSDANANTWNTVVRLTMDNRYAGIGITPSDKLDVGGIIRSSANSRYLRVGPQNTAYAHYETNANSGHWFNTTTYVDGAIWRYNTNYGIASDGYFYAKGMYANRDGASNYGGLSLYSNSDPITEYGIAFRGTGSYGTLQGVTSDWATYFTMNNDAGRGWVFRRGGNNVLAIDGYGSLNRFYTYRLRLPGATAKPAGWYQMCRVSGLDGYFNFNMFMTGSWNTGAPTMALVNFFCWHTTPRIIQLTGHNNGVITKVRLRNISGGDYYLDVYQNYGYTSSDAMSDEYFLINGSVYISEIAEPTAVTSATGGTELSIRDIDMLLDTNTTYVNSSGYGYINGKQITQISNADTLDGYHANRFAFTYNSENYQASSSVTVNDLVTYGVSNASHGMIYSATDNPVGSNNWVHVWSQQWSISVTSSWVSQLAIGVQQKTGLWYRTNGSGSIVGKAWTRVLDSANWSGIVDGRYVKKTGDSMSGQLYISVPTTSKSAPTSQQLVIEGPGTSQISDSSMNLQSWAGIGFHMPGRTWGSIVFNGEITGVNSSYNGYVYFYGAGFKKNGSNGNYVLTGDGGHWEVHAGRNNNVNKIVRTDSNGYLQTGWINTTSGDMGTDAMDRVYCSYDGYIRYKTKANFITELGGPFLPLAGGWMDWAAPIYFQGPNTSVYGRIKYASTSISGFTMHNGGQSYALYIDSNGYSSAGDSGGLAIDNDGVTVFGAGDDGKVFRVINEDNVNDGAQFLVTKASGAYVKKCLSVGYTSVNTSYLLYVDSSSSLTYSVYIAGKTYVANSIISDSLGGSWISARDHCIVKNTRTCSYGNDWHPIIGFKTSAGFWSFGSVGGEHAAFSYDTDTNYNNSSNTSIIISLPGTSSGSAPTSGGTLLYTGNTYVSGNKGYINYTEITLVEVANKVAFTAIGSPSPGAGNKNFVVCTASSLPSSRNADTVYFVV